MRFFKIAYLIERVITLSLALALIWFCLWPILTLLRANMEALP